MAIVTFKVILNAKGEAIIKLPEGKTQQMDASKIAALTDKLSKALGTVKERHVGRTEHGVHTHDDGMVHLDH